MKLFKRSEPAEPQRRSMASQTSLGRNRTFSYHASRSQAELNTGREAVQSKPSVRRLPSKLRQLRMHAGWLAGIALVLGLIVYQLQLSVTPQVVSLGTDADAPFLQESRIYQDAASKLFDGSATNRNKLTVNADDIAADLQNQFPELDEVSVSLPVIGDRPTVYVRPADPALVLTATNGTFIIDSKGRALAKATAGFNLSRLQVPTVTDQSSLDVELGEQVLPRSATAFMATVVAQLKARGFTVQSMTLPAAAGELNVYVSGKPYFIRYNLQTAGKGQGGSGDDNPGEQTAVVQTGSFIAVMERLNRQGIIPAQYVDVRLEGRAYYK